LHGLGAAITQNDFFITLLLQILTRLHSAGLAFLYVCGEGGEISDSQKPRKARATEKVKVIISLQNLGHFVIEYRR